MRSHRLVPLTSPIFTLPTFALLILALLTTTVAFGQQGDSTVFVESVDVDVINVEVFVTDKTGAPVVGLEAKDFEITEDGQDVEITNFFTSSRPDRIAESLDRDLEELARAPAPPSLRPLPEDQQLNLVVYIDNFNLRPEHKKRVLADLEGFLEDRLIQGDRIMMVGYNRQLKVFVPFTRQREEVFEGLEELGKVATHRPIADAERNQVMRAMSASASGTTGQATGQLSDAYQRLRSHVQSARSDLNYSARALRQMVRSLAGAPGRKAILYVSSGLPQRPGEELYQHLLNLFGDQAFQGTGGAAGFIDPSIEALQEDESHLFSQITREANSHQVTLYTLDARGTGGASTLSAEFGSLSPGDAGRTVMDQIRTHNLQEPLIDMAATTGGRAILDTNNFDGALVDMGHDFDAFYSLGYRPPQGRDGKYHKIEVKVKGRGFKVRHRTGYESKAEIERVGDRTLSSLLLGLEKNPHKVTVNFGDPKKTSPGKFELPVMVRVPLDEVTLLFQEKGAEGRLQFFLVVQDEDGISEVHRQSYPVSIPTAQIQKAKGREIGYAAKLKIRKGTPNIAVGVWDELSGVESFVQQRVLVEGDKARKKRKGGKRRGR